MALADYFRRSAVAAAQVIGGYDEEAIRERVEGITVGLVLSDSAAQSAEGMALADLVMRLLARLYPVIAVDAPDHAGLPEIAVAINPNVEVVCGGRSDVAIVIGEDGRAAEGIAIYAGSDGFVAIVGTVGPFSVGSSENPFGPGVAACLAVANVFRHVFLTSEVGLLDEHVRLSALDLRPEGDASPDLEGLDIGETVLVGAGAIGHGAAWALSRASLKGRLHVVDHESLDLGNLQRYVLAERRDVGREKAPLLSQLLPEVLHPQPHVCDWQHFCAEHGYAWNRVLVGVDSARARRAVQATLPRWVANAWTQPGDLGVSTHPWSESGACLACLYLPRGTVPSDDQVIAQALGLQGQEVEIRRLLHTGQAVPAVLLEEIGRALSVPADALAEFADRPLRDLYAEGVCGGALLSLGGTGTPAADVHVPVAHQSALAGVLLAAQLVGDALGCGADETHIARVDVLRTLGADLVQPAGKDPRGICICQDPDYRQGYQSKWDARQ